MTEELHLRISRKGCRARLGEASWEGLSVPVSPCPPALKDNDIRLLLHCDPRPTLSLGPHCPSTKPLL